MRSPLAATTKTLTPTWLYDDAGSVLYDAMTRLPAYYPGLARNSRFSTGGPLEMVR